MLLISLDMIGTHDTYAPEARKTISEKYGIPVEGIVLAATHTHSGPDLDKTDFPPVANFITTLIEKLTALAGKALSDRTPAAVEYGVTHNEGMNYVRHYVLENGDICGDNFGDPKVSPYAGHVSDADREIRIVKFRRENAADVLLVNWQAHPTMASTIATEHGRAHRPLISADYIGACRRYVEEKTGMHFVYFLGAAGNINSRSRMETEVDTRDHVEYGGKLGDYILAGAKQLQPMTNTKVDYASSVLEASLNHTEDHLVPQAQIIYDQWVKTNDSRHCTELAVPYGIHSPYHATHILAKEKLGKTMSFSVGAGRVGDLGFGFFPYEMFDTNGKQVREGSDFALTLILSCANGRHSYFPSKQAFVHGCYEADSCKFSPGIGETSAERVIALLNELHGEA
jgi:hypothetical protein